MLKLLTYTNTQVRESDSGELDRGNELKLINKVKSKCGREAVVYNFLQRSARTLTITIKVNGIL